MKTSTLWSYWRMSQGNNFWFFSKKNKFSVALIVMLDVYLIISKPINLYVYFWCGEYSNRQKITYCYSNDPFLEFQIVLFQLIQFIQFCSNQLKFIWRWSIIFFISKEFEFQRLQHFFSNRKSYLSSTRKTCEIFF